MAPGTGKPKSGGGTRRPARAKLKADAIAAGSEEVHATALPEPIDPTESEAPPRGHRSRIPYPDTMGARANDSGRPRRVWRKEGDDGESGVSSSSGPARGVDGTASASSDVGGWHRDPPKKSSSRPMEPVLPPEKRASFAPPPPHAPIDVEELSVDDRPLAETLVPTFLGVPGGPTGETATMDLGLESPDVTDPFVRVPTSEELGEGGHHTPVALGETLQLVRYARRADTLLISGITPHGRRLTFEQREDGQGWYVVAAGRRRRPTERELGLVVATITQEMEAAMVPDPERQSEVRSAYRLAVASPDQPGVEVRGLEAYRDILLDEAAAYTAGQTRRLAVIAVDYQAFKRFANRHGHRIGAAFVRALGERLYDLFHDEPGVQVFHKSGKSFRLVVINRTSQEKRKLVERITSDETREWLVTRVWGREDQRTHPDEVHFHIGIAAANRIERRSDYVSLAQRLNDDAYRAGKLGQFKGHTSLVLAKSEYRTSVYQWNIGSEDELQDLAAQMDDGPADVMAEMTDYLHELVPADLEGMAVAGDLQALIFCAISREGFWQGTTAMRIAGERLMRRILEGLPREEDEHDYVGGFDLGDEFYGIALEDEKLCFARGDINSAGATRVRAGLESVRRAVGWRRDDGGGIVGRFLGALADTESRLNLAERITRAAQASYEENAADARLRVNDAVDIGDFLFTPAGEPIADENVFEGAELRLALPGQKPRPVKVIDRRSGFILVLEIDGVEYAAAYSESIAGPQVKLRIRDTVASAAICVLELSKRELENLLREVREDNNLEDDAPVDIIGFLRHVTDILLEDIVKQPGKVELALGEEYDATKFVRAFNLEDVREGYPGLFYEAVHQDLITAQPVEIDRQLAEVIGQTMLISLRPRPEHLNRRPIR